MRVIMRVIMKITALLSRLGIFFLVVSCASSPPKVDSEESLSRNEEFESAVKITVPAEAPPASGEADKKSEVKPADLAAGKSPVKPIAKATPAKVSKKPVKTPLKVPAPEVFRREPDLEDDEGFSGRRPLVDPFRVGEKVVHSVRYFKVEAGTLTLKVDPFVEVNGRKSYSFVTEVKTSSFYESFYKVNDRVVALMDYELLIPRVFTMHLKESKQVKEARSFFDFDKMQATYWEKKITEENGEEVKKLQWEILSYSQNVFSSIFYMRTFKWDLNKEYAFRVADDGENLIFKGKALRREVLDTDLGKMKAVVIKPEIMTKGAFKPVGDIYIWLSDDDRKLVLRIESKIKIGTLVSEIQSMDPGK